MVDYTGKSRANEAFISMLAGYQVYKAKSSSSPIEINKYKTSKAFVDLKIPRYFKEDESAILNLYVGNRTYYKSVPPRALGVVSDSTHRNVSRNFKKQKYSGNRIMQGFFPRMVKRLEEDGDKIMIGDRSISTPSERIQAISKDKPQVRNPNNISGADPVDVMHKGKAYQVTFSPIERGQHHGIYGKGHTAMINDFRKYEKEDLSEKQLDKKKAKRALNYFRDRVVVFNRAMKQMQHEPLKGKMTAQDTSALRADILRAGGGQMKSFQGFRIQNRRGFNKMAGNVTGFFNKTAANFVRTALGAQNFAAYTAGATYTFPLSRAESDRYKFVHLGNFQIHSNRGFIQFNKRALRHAEVVQGHDSLSAQLAVDLGAKSEYEVASKMFHAQIASEAKVEGDKTQMMKLISTNAAGAKSKTRWYPSIDLVHADKQLSKWLSTNGVKRVKKWFRKYTANNDNTMSKALGPKRSFEVGEETFWALPYLSFADYDIRRFD